MTDSQKGSTEVKATNSDIRKVNKGDITELKAFANPPQYVKIVMDAVCVMFGISPSWKNAKRLLGDANFITRIQSYDVDNISPEIMTKIREEYLKDPNFTEDSIRQKAASAASLYCWISDVEKYDKQKHS